MASGLPVVASNLDVHREICADAALYFPYRSPEDLAEQIARVASNNNFRETLLEKGASRVRQFSWRRHVDELLNLARTLVEGCSQSQRRP